MSIRLQEMHPSLVRFLIALLPLSVGADLVGRMTGNRRLLGFGRRSIVAAAAGAAVTALSGLIAQEEVNVEGKTMDMLITPRNLNLAATGVAPAGGQWRQDAPELGEAGETTEFVKETVVDLGRGVKHLAQELAQGKIVPSLTDGRGAGKTAPAPGAATPQPAATAAPPAGKIG